jgi:hypothetical protein
VLTKLALPTSPSRLRSTMNRGVAQRFGFQGGPVPAVTADALGLAKRVMGSKKWKDSQANTGDRMHSLDFPTQSIVPLSNTVTFHGPQGKLINNLCKASVDDSVVAGILLSDTLEPRVNSKTAVQRRGVAHLVINGKNEIQQGDRILATGLHEIVKDKSHFGHTFEPTSEAVLPLVFSSRDEESMDEVTDQLINARTAPTVAGVGLVGADDCLRQLASGVRRHPHDRVRLAREAVTLAIRAGAGVGARKYWKVLSREERRAHRQTFKTIGYATEQGSAGQKIAVQLTSFT